NFCSVIFFTMVVRVVTLISNPRAFTIRWLISATRVSRSLSRIGSPFEFRIFSMKSSPSLRISLSSGARKIDDHSDQIPVSGSLIEGSSHNGFARSCSSNFFTSHNHHDLIPTSDSSRSGHVHHAVSHADDFHLVAYSESCIF